MKLKGKFSKGISTSYTKIKKPPDVYPSPYDPDFYYDSYYDAVKADEAQREYEGHIRSEYEKERKRFEKIPWNKRDVISKGKGKRYVLS